MNETIKLDAPQPTEGSPLLPIRHPNLDFFVCDIMDAAPKGDIASMEHPVFSLSTKPDHRIRRYEHNNAYIDIKPSAEGLATIHDRDILIFCISKLIASINNNENPSQVVRFKAYELLVATNRSTSGTGYEGLKMALERLAGTRISTNIVTGGEETFETFGIIERAKIVRETSEGRMQEVEVKLSDWVYNAVKSKEVLTLHRNYFRLRKPIERRMYELARKHCGSQSEWKVSLGILQKKCGSGSTAREFKRLVKKIIEQDEKFNHMPDYSFRMDGEAHVVIKNKGKIKEISNFFDRKNITLSPEVYHKARLIARGHDIYVLEQDWRSWMKETPKNPEAAFLGFCKKVAAEEGAAKM